METNPTSFPLNLPHPGDALLLSEDPFCSSSSPFSFANKTEDETYAVRFFDTVLQDAVTNGYSDIHLEPKGLEYRIRCRLDGQLLETAVLSTPLAKRLINRSKVLSDLDISETRIPQDGKFSFFCSGAGAYKIDCRLSTCPTTLGEKIVIRVLNHRASTLDIHELGFTEKQLYEIHRALNHTEGMIILTGPTGSGKTTTLYSFLNYLNRIEKHIVTVEDPVEISFPGITQINVNNKIGLTFQSLLPALLRQDPDIMMIGELRETTTAQIAIEAAHTGHLILSTLHSKNALEAIIRLQHLGVEGFNIASSVNLIIAQRLVRRFCADCQKIIFQNPELSDSDKPNQDTLLLSHCGQCNQGFKGRMAIFEVLKLTDKLKTLISEPKWTLCDLHCLLTAEGAYQTLYQAGLEKVASLYTSYYEIKQHLSSPSYSSTLYLSEKTS